MRATEPTNLNLLGIASNGDRWSPVVGDTIQVHTLGTFLNGDDITGWHNLFTVSATFYFAEVKAFRSLIATVHCSEFRVIRDGRIVFQALPTNHYN